MNLPNALTLARIFLVPLLVVVLLTKFEGHLVLGIASVSETVQVTSETPLIDVKANATTASLTSQEIELIPKGRGLLSVLTQIPGTNNESRNGGLVPLLEQRDRPREAGGVIGGDAAAFEHRARRCPDAPE